MNTPDTEWLRYAKDPVDPLTLAIGGVMNRFSLASLDDHELFRIRERYFPKASITAINKANDLPSFRVDEVKDLVDLMMDHRSDESDDTYWLAHAIATACMGNDHLYQDMGLAHREVLSGLLKKHFSTLFAKNTGNMKWKKFFYKQLCDREEVNMCKAPSCGVCNDYAKCFGPE